MTTQIADTILINGEIYETCHSALEDYWSKRNNKPSFCSFNTGINRGYYARWELLNNKLYLIDFFGQEFIFTNHNYREYSLQDIFPNKPKVFANWFKGHLEIPFGEQNENGFYKAFQVLYFSKGIVMDISMRQNKLRDI